MIRGVRATKPPARPKSRLFARSLLLAAALALSACGGEAGAEVQSQCDMSGNRTGTCTVTILSLQDAFYRHTIDDKDFWPAGTVEVEIHVTVEKGSARVWFEDPERKQVAAIVEPGKTTELRGRSWLDSIGDRRSFYIYFEWLDTGESVPVENLRAEIEYDMPYVNP